MMTMMNCLTTVNIFVDVAEQEKMRKILRAGVQNQCYVRKTMVHRKFDVFDGSAAPVAVVILAVDVDDNENDTFEEGEKRWEAKKKVNILKKWIEPSDDDDDEGEIEA